MKERVQRGRAGEVQAFFSAIPRKANERTSATRQGQAQPLLYTGGSACQAVYSRGDPLRSPCVRAPSRSARIRQQRLKALPTSPHLPRPYRGGITRGFNIGGSYKGTTYDSSTFRR